MGVNERGGKRLFGDILSRSALTRGGARDGRARESEHSPISSETSHKLKRSKAHSLDVIREIDLKDASKKAAPGHPVMVPWYD